MTVAAFSFVNGTLSYAVYATNATRAKQWMKASPCKYQRGATYVGRAAGPPSDHTLGIVVPKDWAPVK